jgi:hypothetical protein
VISFTFFIIRLKRKGETRKRYLPSHFSAFAKPLRFN